MNYYWSSAELEIIPSQETLIVDSAYQYLETCSPQVNGKRITNLREHVVEGKVFSIFPARSNLFIADQAFIKSCNNPISLFDYYKNKIDKYDSAIYVCFMDSVIDVKPLGEFGASLLTYREILKNVILDIGPLSKDTIRICPEIFNALDSAFLEKNEKYCQYITEFLSLLVISDRVVSLNEDLTEFDFQIFTQESTVHISNSWIDVNNISTGCWFACYKWIVSEKQQSIDLELKRHIVRESITKHYAKEAKEYFCGIEEADLIRTFDSVLRLIVSGRTQEYFETQKVLKNEYTEIYSKNNDFIASITNKIIVLILALVAGMYGLFFHDGQVLDLSQPSKQMGVLLIVFAFAEACVLIYSIIKLSGHNKYVEKLQEINEVKLMISKDDQKDFFVNYRSSSIFIFSVQSLLYIATIVGCIWFFR